MACYLSDGSDCEQFYLLSLHHLRLFQIVLCGWRRGREEREGREGGEGGKEGREKTDQFSHTLPPGKTFAQTMPKEPLAKVLY